MFCFWSVYSDFNSFIILWSISERFQAWHTAWFAYSLIAYHLSSLCGIRASTYSHNTRSLFYIFRAHDWFLPCCCPSKKALIVVWTSQFLIALNLPFYIHNYHRHNIFIISSKLPIYSYLCYFVLEFENVTDKSKKRSLKSAFEVIWSHHSRVLRSLLARPLKRPRFDFRTSRRNRFPLHPWYRDRFSW